MVSCLLGDFTGAVQGDLWRGAAETYLPRFLEWSQRPEERVFFELSRCSAKADNRRVLQPTRKLVFSDASVIARVQEPGPQAAAELCGDLVVHDFEMLTAAVPFVANPCGYVTNVSTLTSSRSGAPM